MDVYMNDMLVKSFRAESHVDDIQRCFAVLNKYDMKLNPAKYTFAVTSGKFLSYIITKRGIKPNPRKITSILELLLPKKTW